MSDPIERQAAIDEIQRFLGYIDQDMIDRIKIGLRKLPTIDPAENGGCWGCCCEKLGQAKEQKMDTEEGEEA